MRQPITVELDIEIIERLTEYGTLNGWTLEETIRYQLGNNLPSLFKSIPAMPFSTSFPTSPLNNQIKQMATLFASTGLSKCPACLNKLTSEELIKGECSKCEVKI